jgi:hypothetical protein
MHKSKGQEHFWNEEAMGKRKSIEDDEPISVSGKVKMIETMSNAWNDSSHIGYTIPPA